MWVQMTHLCYCCVPWVCTTILMLPDVQSNEKHYGQVVPRLQAQAVAGLQARLFGTPEAG